MPLNRIQKIILSKLIKSQGLKFTQAKPNNIENDLYNYHLQHLVNKGYVTKIKGIYLLTEKGKNLTTEEIELSNPHSDADKFKVSVLCCVIRKNKDNDTIILNQTRLRHPFYGDTGLISGKVHKEEKVADAASRVLFKKTGLSAKFRVMGLIRKIRYVKSQRNFFSDGFLFLCVSDEYTGELETQNQYGKNEWLTKSETERLIKSADQGGPYTAGYIKKLNFNNQEETPFFYFEEYRTIKGV